MATKTNDTERRSQVAEACLDFGSNLLRARTSSVTPDDAQNAVKDLFSWFSSHDAFSDGNVGIATHSLDFGGQLLEARKTSTVQEAIDAIQDLYLHLSS